MLMCYEMITWESKLIIRLLKTNEKMSLELGWKEKYREGKGERDTGG